MNANKDVIQKVCCDMRLSESKSKQKKKREGNWVSLIFIQKFFLCI